MIDPEDMVDEVELLDEEEVEAIDSDEEEVTFGEESQPITEIRNAFKDKARENAELKRRVADLEEKTRPAPVDVGPKPTFEECNYDEETFEAAIDAWHETKANAQTVNAEIAKPDQELAKQFQDDVTRFQTGVTTLPQADAQDTVEAALRALSPAQQTGIVQVTKDPAKFVFALGRNPEKLAELAGMANGAKFIAEVVRLEMNMTTRKKAAVDAPLSGSSGVSAGSKGEERLLEKARVSGDYNAYYAAKRGKK